MEEIFIHKNKNNSKGQAKGKTADTRKGYGLSLNIGAVRETVSAPTTPVETQTNIGYECIIFEGQGQGKRRREDSTSPGKEVVVSRMAERLLRLHAQLDRATTELVALVKVNINTKVEIKNGISSVRSLASQMVAAEMRTAVEGLAGTQEQARPRTIIMADASTQTGGEDRRELAHSATQMVGDSAGQIGQRVQGADEGLEGIRRAIQDIQSQLDVLVDKDRKKGQKTRKQMRRQESSGGVRSTPSSEVLEGVAVAESAAPGPPGDWAEVVRRGSQAERRERQKQHLPQQPPGKGQGCDKVVKNLRDRPTRILVNLTEANYKEAREKLKGGLSREQTAAITCARRSEAGNLVLEMKRGAEATGLVSRINEVLGGQHAKLTEGSRQVLEIKYLEEDATEREVIEACEKVLGSTGSVKVVWTRAYGRRGEKVALIECPTDQAKSLLQEGKVRVGWNLCKVEPRRARIEPCWRCRSYGHRAEGCKGPDRRDCCRRCGIPGHKEAECSADPKCIACEDKGLEVGHFAGSRKCLAYAEAVSGRDRGGANLD